MSTKKGLLPVARFELPADWSPTGVRCCMIPIPDDPDYFAMICGLVDTLRWSSSYERDDTSTGAATVARTWGRALESQPFLMADCEDTMYRYKPTDALTTQVSTDGGATWIDIWRNCCDAIPVVPPVTDTLEDREDVSGAMLRAFMIWIAQTIIDELTAGHDKDTAVNTIMDSLAPYGAGASVRAQIAHAWDGLNASGSRSDYVDECNWVPEWEGLTSYAGSNTNWLDGLAQWLFDWLDSTADSIYYDLNAAAAAMGGDNLWNWTQGNGGAGGGAGFGSTCGYDHTVTFDTGGLPYSIVHGVLAGGGNPGQCLYREVYLDGSVWQSLSWITCPLPAGLLQDVSFNWKAHNLASSETVGIGFQVLHADGSLAHNGNTDFDAAGLRDVWTNRYCAIGANWTIITGDYLLLYIGQTRFSEAAADDCQIYLDNVRTVGTFG